MKTIKEELPDVYRNILPKFFNNAIPTEELATCNNCAMLGEEKGADNFKNQVLFSSKLKCCTFYPTLPNYLVGGILASQDKNMSEGKRIVSDLIENGPNVSPLGIAKPKRLEVLVNASSKTVFGRSTVLICPYYSKDNGHCTIWKNRNAVCSTWFCKYVKGKDGEIFYDKLKRYLSNTEKVITNFVLLKSGFTANEIFEMQGKPEDGKMNHFEIDGVRDNAHYSKIWGNHAGQEVEFYKRCYSLVSDMSKSTFNKISGLELDLHLGILKQAYKNMQHPRLPQKLILNPNIVILKTPCGEYNINNSFSISDILYQAIQFFDGYDHNKTVLTNIEKKLNVSLDKELLISLYQNRVLIDSKEFIF